MMAIRKKTKAERNNFVDGINLKQQQLIKYLVYMRSHQGR